MDSALARALLDWRARCRHNLDGDYLSAGPEKHCKQPYWPDSLLRRVIRPAAFRANIRKQISGILSAASSQCCYKRAGLRWKQLKTRCVTRIEPTLPELPAAR